MKSNLIREVLMMQRILSSLLRSSTGVLMFAILVLQPAMSGVAEASQVPERETPTVLFICPHGAGKSVLVTAYFKQLAAERGIRIRTDAVGTEPGPEVGAAAAARLNQQGLAVPIAKPR